MRAEQVVLHLRDGEVFIEVLGPGRAWQSVSEIEVPASALVALIAEVLDTRFKRGEAIFGYRKMRGTLRLTLNRLKVEISPKKAFRLKLQNGRYPERFMAVIVLGTGSMYDYLPKLLKGQMCSTFELMVEEESRRVYRLRDV
ncbi:hypothetical protein [Thermococcus aciditolerans]|uniref:Uncharacterized protein n=1 Tax=Thermococcus aciditolerans TaxID=2598455 RepID=A0A5C0SKL7_9EURY|nr:hypothetical protein [Thermococcus aciditolerans]QEK14963.1 hypothetical protein FPV09_07520 [Thermococcus aciditolerans]